MCHIIYFSFKNNLLLIFFPFFSLYPKCMLIVHMTLLSFLVSLKFGKNILCMDMQVDLNYFLKISSCLLQIFFLKNLKLKTKPYLYVINSYSGKDPFLQIKNFKYQFVFIQPQLTPL
jgi:hypothetical protein